MKKKILAIAIAAIMVLTAVASVSLAYLTDTDEQDNVFTIGNVKIDQLEYERVKDTDGNKTTALKDFTDNQKVFPAVYDLPGGDPARMYDLTVNGYTLNKYGVRTFPNYVDKIVTVKNTGNSDAYVRTIIAVPVIPNEDESDGNVSESWLHWNSVSDTDTTPANGWYHGKSTADGEYPEYASQYTVKNVRIGEKYYDINVITNINPLKPGEETAPCMTGFYLDNSLNCDEGGWFMPCEETADWNDGNPDDGKWYVITANEKMIAENVILVATQAVQTEGFADAWQAFAASFGEIDHDNHPWYVEPVEQQ